MKKWMAAILACVALVAAACGGGDSVDTLNVAYFAEWPTPNQAGQADGTFADAVGVDEINWVPFTSGGEMSEAMIAGDIDIAYSQGLTPFAGAINNGADLKLVGIAVSYSDADNCIASGDLGLTRANAADVLSGATVMTPFGNVTHYKMLKMMEFLNVNLDDLNIVQAEGGATTAAAFEVGDIDVGCAFGGSIENMIANGGEPLFTGAEQQSDVGIFTYDIVSIPTSFGEENGDIVTSFLKATEEFNDSWRADGAAVNNTIALAAGMEDVGNFLDGELWFQFPSVAEQLSSDWMGGKVGAAMQGQVATLAELGGGDPATGDFIGSVDTSFLEAIDG
jgi:taurine transport system substrate-binding protein